MRGRTKCPKCGNRFILEVPDQSIGEYPASCPECGHSFNIDIKKYSWEGETDEVVPPSLHVKPSSSKPMIAGILLIIVFILGIIMGGLIGFSEDLIGEGVSQMGGTGSYGAIVKDENGDPLANVTVILVNNPNIYTETDENGKFLLENVPTGYQKINLSKDGYESLIIKTLIFPGKFEEDGFVMKEGSGERRVESLAVKAIDFLPICSVVFIIFAVIALLGGILSIRRKNLLVAVVCSILGIFSIGFLVGSILSIAALILILLSKEEFGEKPNEVKF